jgi:hypothetical protein
LSRVTCSHVHARARTHTHYMFISLMPFRTLTG